MIDFNKGLFGKLAAAGGDLISAELRSQKRAIRTNDVEKEWLQRLVIRTSSHLHIDSASRFALGEYDENLYLIAVGVEVEEPSAELRLVQLNAGAFTAIVHELDVPILHSSGLSERLLEYVFYPVEDNCELIEMDVVATFLQKVSLYLVNPESAIAADREFGIRAAIDAILGTPVTRPLKWQESTLDRFRFMIRDPKERAPFHLLLRALTESKDDAAFLALYRCIEQLFPIPAIGNLSNELGLTIPALGVAAAIEKHLGWRRREDVALEQLFSELNDELIDRLLLAIDTEAQTESRSRLASKRVYELRNLCVHFRPAHAVGDGMRIKNWPTLTGLMLEVVQCLYEKYCLAFDERDDAVQKGQPAN